MPSRPRYVFDTNALVSAVLLEHSISGQALRRALRQGVILESLATLGELAEVIQRQRFDRYVSAAAREEFLAAFVARATIVEPTEVVRVCRDAKDDKFLELAVGGAAHIPGEWGQRSAILAPVSRHRNRERV
jgi:putative PIN family toxin of toxin-antitoxin system